MTQNNDTHQGIKKKPAAALYQNSEEKASLESRNVLLQFDEVKRLVNELVISSDTQFKLQPAMIRHLHSLAIQDIYTCAGSCRPPHLKVEIYGSKHKLPPAMDVPFLMGEMCDYVNDNWEKSGIHLSAYVMWRVNWIHPFAGGNGRTARAVSYLVLCARLGYWLPGTITIPLLIENDRKPYFDALTYADEAFSTGSLDVGKMEELISSHLAKQLVKVHEDAAGK
jgi:Fic family protein